jgi:hypothetical protein
VALEQCISKLEAAFLSKSPGRWLHP